MKKILALSLAMLTVLTSISFVSCGDGTDKETPSVSTRPPEDEIEPEYRLELPMTNFNGKEFNILTNNGFWGDTIDEESESDDPVKSAKFKRNRLIEETYGVKINEIQHAEARNAIQTSYNAGTNDYDAVSLCSYDCAALAANGYFQDLSSIENLNLDKHYWDQSMVKSLSVDGKNFFVTGDLFTTPLAGTFVILFNKQLQRDFDLPDFYDMVRNKTWTIDYFSQLINDPSYGYSDNGDGSVDPEDRFGFGMQEEVYLALFYGMGGMLTTKNEADLPVMNLNTRTNYDLVGLVNDVTKKGNNTIDSHEWLDYSSGGFVSSTIFDRGRSLFFSSNASNIAGFREMEDDFGVLPLPLRDSNSEYRSFVYSGSNVVAIPMQNKENSDFAGYMLEVLCAESYRLLTPAYYEQTLKGKYQRDEDSYEMLDIACRNRVWDFGYVCNFGNIYSQFINLIKNGNGTFSSFMTRQERVFKNSLEKYIEAYEKTDSN